MIKDTSLSPMALASDSRQWGFYLYQLTDWYGNTEYKKWIKN